MGRNRNRAAAPVYAAAAVLFAAVATVGAHHSIAALYDSTKQVTIAGTVRAFHFVNPHPWLEVDVTEQGRGRTWRLELDNRFELVAIGMSDETLRPGDAVEVSGSASREAAYGLYVRSLRRSDGLLYEQVGMSPRLRRKP